MNLPAPYDVINFPATSRRTEKPPSSHWGLVMLLFIAAAVSAYLVWRPVQSPERSEPVVTISVGAARDIALQLRSARELNEAVIAEAGGIQTGIRRLAPFFKSNGYATNHRRAVEIDVRAATVARTTNESIDQINLVLEQLKDVEEMK